jgi:hypothetical protein
MNVDFGRNSAKENAHKNNIVNRLLLWVLAASFTSIFALIVSFSVK